MWRQWSVDAQLNAPSLPPNTAKLLKMEENHQNFSQEPARATTKICSPLNTTKKEGFRSQCGKWATRTTHPTGTQSCRRCSDSTPSHTQQARPPAPKTPHDRRNTPRFEIFEELMYRNETQNQEQSKNIPPAFQPAETERISWRWQQYKWLLRMVFFYYWISSLGLAYIDIYIFK